MNRCLEQTAAVLVCIVVWIAYAPGPFDPLALVFLNIQEIFSIDEANYMGHVFAGLADLELGRFEQAKQHYKTAIAAQPDESLAWKVNSHV